MDNNIEHYIIIFCLLCFLLIVNYTISRCSDTYTVNNCLHSKKPAELKEVYKNSLYVTDPQSLEFISHNTQSSIVDIINLNKDATLEDIDNELVKLNVPDYSRERILTNELLYNEYIDEEQQDAELVHNIVNRNNFTLPIEDFNTYTAESTEQFNMHEPITQPITQPLYQPITQPRPTIQINTPRPRFIPEALQLDTQANRLNEFTERANNIPVNTLTNEQINDYNRIVDVYFTFNNENNSGHNHTMRNTSLRNIIDIPVNYLNDKQSVHDNGIASSVDKEYSNMVKDKSLTDIERGYGIMLDTFGELRKYNENDQFYNRPLKSYIGAVGLELEKNENLKVPLKESIDGFIENGHPICTQGKVVKLFNSLTGMSEYGNDLFLLEQLKTDMYQEASDIYSNDEITDKKAKFLEVVESTYKPKYEVKNSVYKYNDIVKDCMEALE